MNWGLCGDGAARLKAEGARCAQLNLRGLFAADPQRFQRFSFRHGPFLIDLSKELLDEAALAALLALADEAGVATFRDAMAAGNIINVTEGRAALHMALRDSVPAPEGCDVAGTRARFCAFAEDVRSGRAAGTAGAFTDVVNIGIGGSDLGPVMAVRALAPDHDGPRVHFVSNVDGAHLQDTLKELDLVRTLFIVASKTFTTQETMANARSALERVRGVAGDRAGEHFAAVSTNLDATRAFGIAPERVFGFWDWVGGRFSLWSAIGLPLAIAIGAERFGAFLAGASDMDRHFLKAPLKENLPVLFALVGVLRRAGLGFSSRALIPYDQRLERFAAYCQQLEMESNGKSVRADGAPVTLPTAPATFGEPGTNAQHSFFQLLHQGTTPIPVDFLLARHPRDADTGHHRLLAANCLAQSRALAFGRTPLEAAAQMRAAGLGEADRAALTPHRSFAGNRPSTTILFDRLDPATLGGLIALFEHKVAVEAAIAGINPFDQWGVELGKDLAREILGSIDGEAGAVLDSSTRGLLAALRPD